MVTFLNPHTTLQYVRPSKMLYRSRHGGPFSMYGLKGAMEARISWFVTWTAWLTQLTAIFQWSSINYFQLDLSDWPGGGISETILQVSEASSVQSAVQGQLRVRLLWAVSLHETNCLIGAPFPLNRSYHRDTQTLTRTHTPMKDRHLIKIKEIADKKRHSKIHQP